MVNGETKMWFGKHKGEQLKDLPEDYLLYIYKEGIAKDDLRIYINSRLNELYAHSAINNKTRPFNKKYYISKKY